MENVDFGIMEHIYYTADLENEIIRKIHIFENARFKSHNKSCF